MGRSQCVLILDTGSNYLLSSDGVIVPGGDIQRRLAIILSREPQCILFAILQDSVPKNLGNSMNCTVTLTVI